MEVSLTQSFDMNVVRITQIHPNSKWDKHAMRSPFPPPGKGSRPPTKQYVFFSFIWKMWDSVYTFGQDPMNYVIQEGLTYDLKSLTFDFGLFLVTQKMNGFFSTRITLSQSLPCQGGVFVSLRAILQNN